MVTRRQRPTSDALRRGPLSPCGYAGARADRARPNDGGLSAVAMNGRCVGRIAVATRAPWPSLTYRRRIRSARRSPIHKPLTFGTIAIDRSRQDRYRRRPKPTPAQWWCHYLPFSPPPATSALINIIGATAGLGAACSRRPEVVSLAHTAFSAFWTADCIQKEAK